MHPVDDATVPEHVRQQLNALMPDTRYILDGHTPVRCQDVLTWLGWYAHAERHVAEDRGDGWHLSTVFLGQTTHPSDDPPLLFETALFVDGRMTDVLQRYATWEEAQHGHGVSLRNISSLLNKGREED